uniref:Protein kinase domain-containing protein n=1 Tax=Oryza glumipatula TaxID=40148 RepID=A0A0E0BLZ6_9ORYZ
MAEPPSLRHKHIICLYGCCVLEQEKRQLLPPFRKMKKVEERLIIYEYTNNGSLHDQPARYAAASVVLVVAGEGMRIETLLGVSRAIEYLQSYNERPVIHCDINSSNILFDAAWAPRLADFGASDPEVMRRPEVRRPLAGLGDTLREAHELVMSCQGMTMVGSTRSYLLVFPFVSHIYITRRLDRIYNILLPNDMSTMPSPSSASHSHQVELQENVVLHGDEGEKFTFAELATATNNFAADREIGKGGFGTVYIGYLLPDGRDEVAIKRTHKDETYGTTAKEFMAELRAGTGEAPASSTVPEDEEGGGAPDRLRVHQQRLASRPPARYNAAAVVLVVAGEDVMELEDAHRDTAGRVASHRIPVVLQRATGDHPPRHQLVKHAVRRHLGATLWRLADFGASVRCDHSTRSVPADAFYGKFGYIDLEYATTAIAKPTIDVYSFGVVMLEVLTGMRALFYQEEDVHKVFDCSEEDRNAIPAVLAEVTPPFIEVGEVLDRRPTPEPTARQLEAAELVAQTAARCMRLQGEDRPAISEVVASLEAALELARCDG